MRPNDTKEDAHSRLLTTAQVAERLSTSVDQVRNLIRAGAFPNAFRKTSRSPYLIPQSDLDTYLSSHKHHFTTRHPESRKNISFSPHSFKLVGGLLSAILAVIAVIIPIIALIPDSSALKLALVDAGVTNPFPVAGPDQTLIIITAFDYSEGLTDTKAQVEIFQSIEKVKADLGLTNKNFSVQMYPVKIKYDQDIESQKTEAQRIGKRFNAAIIIWGSDTGTKVTVNFYDLKQPDFEASYLNIEETTKTQLVYPSAYSQYLIEELPGHLSFLSLLSVGKSYYLTGNYNESIRLIYNAIKLVETNPKPVEGLGDAYYGLCWLYHRVGEYRKSIESCSKYIAINPERADGFNNRGLNYLELDEYQNALNDFANAIYLNPDLAALYSNRGLVYSKLQDYDHALEDFNKAIQLEPNVPISYNNRGILYAETNNKERAFQDFDKAVQLDPTKASGYINRGTVLSDLGKYQLALKDFNDAVEIDPNNAHAFYNRGLFFYNNKEYQLAIQDYDKAILLEPNDADAYSNRGLVYKDINNIQRAIQDYDKALEIDPDHGTAYLNRGIAYFNLGDNQQVINDMENAIQLNPSEEKAYLFRGLAYGKTGSYREAILDFDKSIQFNPSGVEAYADRGIAYSLLGDHQHAIEDYNKAIQLDPSIASIYLERAQSFLLVGKYQEAINDFQQYLKLDPETERRQGIEAIISDLKAKLGNR